MIMAKKARKTQKKKNLINSEAVRLINLRPKRDENGSVYFEAVEPAHYVDEEGWEPAGKVGGQTVFSSESAMKIGDEEYELDGHVRSITENADGGVTVDDGTGRVCRFERGIDGTLIASGSEPDWNPVTIMAERHSVIDMIIEPITFEKLPATGAVGDRDVLSRLGSRLAAAYSEAAENARRRGVLIRPVIVRAIVCDDAGETLYRGPEVLIGADYLTEYVDSVTLGVGADGASTAEKLIQLPAYRLKVVVDPMASQGWVERASKLVIEVSPQFHPDKAGVVSATAGKDAAGHRLVVTVPGSVTALSPAQSERSAKLIEAMVENFDRVKKTAATFNRPYEHGVSETIVTAAYPLLTNELESLKKALLGDVEAASYEERLVAKLNVPNRFSARNYATDGTGTILAGNIDWYRFEGYQARALACRVNNALGFSSKTTVTFSDGSSVSRLDSGSAGAPVAMNPVAVYPGDDATSVKLTVSYSDGTVKTWSYALSPSRSGRFSIGVLDDISVSEGKTADDGIGVPATVTKVMPVHLDRVIVTMEMAQPRTVTAAGVVEGRVTAVVARPANGGAWEFGRSRFIVGTSEQLVSAIVHENRKKIALNKLSDNKINSSCSLISTPDGTVYFVESGRIYRVSGTTITELGASKSHSPEFDSIAYDKYSRRLIVGSSNGAALFLHLDPDETMPEYFTPSLGPFNYLGLSEGKVFCATQSGLYVFPDKEVVEEECENDISMVVKVTTADPMRAIRRVIWPVMIDGLSGCVKVERSQLPMYRGGFLSGWLVNGAILSSIRFPIVALSITQAYATVEGTVTLGPGKRCVLALPE